MNNKSVPNRQIAEEAAQWAVRIDEGPLGPEDSRALSAWLKASPRHVEELLINAMLLEDCADADRGHQVDMAALASMASADVVPLTAPAATGSDAPADNGPAKGRPWYARLAPAAIAATVALVAVAAVLLQEMAWRSPQATVVSTGLGEQRTITLDDGSVVYVNTLSTIQVRYGDTERLVELVQGEALFNVEKDPARPFRVVAGDMVAEALGTRFNVRYIGERAAVSVVEGTVAFAKAGMAFNHVERAEPGNGEARPGIGRIEDGRVVLVAGERVELTEADDAPRVAVAKPGQVASWRTRQLFFDNDTLMAIADEFNRYNRKRLVIADRRLRELRFTGVFDADDPESFVAFLKLTGDVAVSDAGSELRLSKAR